MKAALLLVGLITRIAIAAGVIYLIYKVGKFLDVLPGILAKKHGEPKEESE
ncbi:MAG: hypothetical protein PVF58_06830 [Candidatus Methanofastidiosia archaeon]|jgi:hypothetical protein